MRQILSFIALFFIVFSLSAQQVYDSSRVDLSFYAKGIYVVQRQNRKGLFSQRVVLE